LLCPLAASSLVLLGVGTDASTGAAVCAKQPYKFISLEGGGVKGIAYGGAAAALESAGLLDDVEGYSGSSAGSQAAALMAIGYTGKELTEELVGMDFTELLWASRGSAGNRFPNVLDDLMGLMDKFGWFSGDVMESMIDELIERKTGLKGTTFKQMKEWNGGKVRLRITAVCVNTQRLMWLDADTAPDMSIAKAVRASSSIPIFFQPVEHEGLLLVDGGCIRNLPHDAFPDDEGSMLALSLRGEMEEFAEINNLLDFAGQLAEAVFSGPDSANSLVRPEDDEDVDLVAIDHGDVGPIDFALSLNKKLWLVKQGFDAVSERIQECGGGQLLQLPEWYRAMKVEAEQMELQQETDGLPKEIGEHVKNLKASLDDFAAEFDVCMKKENGDVAKCGFKAGKGAVEGGEIMTHLAYIVKVLLKDKRFMAGLALVVLVAVGVLFLAGIGFKAWRDGRKEEVEKKKS